VDGGKAATGILADGASCNGLCRYNSMGPLDNGEHLLNCYEALKEIINV